MGSKLGFLALGLALAAAAAAIGWSTLGGDEEPEVFAGTQGAAPTIDELQARAEADPDNPGAWQELGFARFERGEFAQAVAAYERAAALDSDNAVLWSSLGEARVMASERDPMPPSAVEAFERAIALDPDDPRARYFMAVRKDLSGNHEGAVDDWLALLDDTPPGAPWEGDLVRTIEQVGRINSISVEERLAAVQSGRAERFAVAPETGSTPPLTGAAGIPGPSQEQLEAARAMSPDEQRTMAEGMVSRLEERLQGNPTNIDGWVMLMRSRMTLGQAAQARQALARAKAANPGDAARLDAEAEALRVR